MRIDLQKNPADTMLMGKAALGEPDALKELQERQVLFAQRLGLCFAISTEVNGRQKGILSEHQINGGGIDQLIEIPLSFRIKSVSIEEQQIVLHAKDGRVLEAEPEQFGLRRLVRERNNPDYEVQLEHDFFSIPFKCLGQADHYIDDLGKQWTYNVQIGGYWLKQSQAEQAKQQPEVSCEANHRAELMELLPVANLRLDRLELYVRMAKAYLWEMGSAEQRAELNMEDFGALLRVESVNFKYYGDLELWIGDKDGELFDGYSPTVYFDSNDRIVDWAMNG